MGEIANRIIEDDIHGIDRDAIKKYYIVWIGQVPGIYSNWNDCSEQVTCFTNAKYKSFVCDYTEAEKLFNNGITSNNNVPISDPSELSPQGYILKSIAVDAACASNPGPVEYRGVDVETGKIIFEQGPHNYGTNNLGEFIAIVHALAYLKKLNSNIPVYSDSKIAIEWVKNKKANTTMTRTQLNKSIFNLLDRAEKWLAENSYNNLILKWETKRWGEIVADYQRKK